MFKNKNDYSVIVYYKQGNEKRFYKVEYVHNVLHFVRWLDNSYLYKDWLHINVYNRRTGQFIIQYKKNDYVQPKPR